VNGKAISAVDHRDGTRRYVALGRLGVDTKIRARFPVQKHETTEVIARTSYTIT